MKVLLTGANGYIGKRLSVALLDQQHELIYCVRDKFRFQQENEIESRQVIEVDFLKRAVSEPFPEDIDVAFFLIHSMREGADFEATETKVATGFLELISRTRCRQIVYLSGIVNADHLSPHLASRLAVEKILKTGHIPLTVLRAGIVVGSGSSSFEIIRDLVEKLPVMITPKWVNTKCQPISIRNVIEFLSGVMLKTQYYGQDYDIGGTEVLTYKEMILRFASIRGLKRHIWTVPVMSPKISSYWLFFVTSTSYSLAQNLVDSMKVDVICRPNTLAQELKILLLSYSEAVALAFQKIEQDEVVSSWKDAFSAFNTDPSITRQVEVPRYGCFTDLKEREVVDNPDRIFDNIWKIGGDKGWYYGNSLWKARGFLDKAFGGVGLRRGRTNPSQLHPGDTLDFWRVLIADKKQYRLLLFAEMKLPGEAWLEFTLKEKAGKRCLVQKATFRPKGLLGRLYWYSVLPFHYFIFNGMINNLVKTK